MLALYGNPTIAHISPILRYFNVILLTVYGGKYYINLNFTDNKGRTDALTNYFIVMFLWI